MHSSGVDMFEIQQLKDELENERKEKLSLIHENEAFKSKEESVLS